MLQTFMLPRHLRGAGRRVVRDRDRRARQRHHRFPNGRPSRAAAEPAFRLSRTAGAQLSRPWMKRRPTFRPCCASRRSMSWEPASRLVPGTPPVEDGGGAAFRPWKRRAARRRSRGGAGLRRWMEAPAWSRMASPTFRRSRRPTPRRPPAPRRAARSRTRHRLELVCTAVRGRLGTSVVVMSPQAPPSSPAAGQHDGVMSRTSPTRLISSSTSHPETKLRTLTDPATAYATAVCDRGGFYWPP